MNRIFLFSLTCLLLGLNTYGQNIQILDELYGFRLGQYSSIVQNELGEPDKVRIFEDSTKVDFYFLTSDSSTHIAFFYLNGKDEIYSIQVTGEYLKIPFYGVRLGDPTTMLRFNFPQADTIISTDFNDTFVKTWKYYNANYSFVFSGNSLNSIKIWDEETKNQYVTPNLTEIFEIISKLDTSKIANILSPNLEVFYCDNVLSWKNSFYTDIYTKSSVFDFITNKQYGLITLAKYDTIPAEYNIRFIEGLGTFPVYKIENDPLISEIVFNYQQGNYKIWEIKYHCNK